MIPKSKQSRMVIFAALGALATVASALIWKGTEHENTWLYVFCVWLVLYSALEVYLKKSKDK